ncbi:MAG: SDR family NAD(P)-dependent oxidoreductase [Rhodobacteraceae bacterium]|nr:SDR family NAD(P)-dependent oxidoreductase [Paracoccaceae bacterium]MYF45890.1 SDR family NAD(P)-dependent oxidoreductase [Paracoccaceae bacterium]MYI90635.1 SDR family NAD(P)-dependent oxidoreductase [Paracoccaceae bacterium]
MHKQHEDPKVAVVGYAYQMPGGIRNDEDFWKLLCDRSFIQNPIRERYGRGYLPIGGYFGPTRMISPYEGHVLDEDECLLDHKFFGISHNEFINLDPQARMLLTKSWQAIEHAGWTLNELHNSKTGVFVGSQTPAAANYREMYGVSEYTAPVASLAMLANRISYHFNLMGTSMTCCTACSAGLSALHTALNAIRNGDCDQALVGAVNFLGIGRLSCSFSQMGIISPDGVCRSFDAEANGYMRSEGAFVYALKPLSVAENDGDQIYAVIESTALNTAGSADESMGLAPGRTITAPTIHSQKNLMQEAAIRAGRKLVEFDYIEAHATGTEVGDAIEGNAIAEAYGGQDRDVPLRVSSVKSNIGHMEAAAFHGALLKVILMMKHRTFAPTSHNFVIRNPAIDFHSCPMDVQIECEEFPERETVFGINSFGFGGANGHCVVSEYRPKTPKQWSIPLAPADSVMIPVSARNTEALTSVVGDLRKLINESRPDLYTLAGNLSTRRTHFAYRTAFTVNNCQELIDILDTFPDNQQTAIVDENNDRLAMVFTGQGAQWQGCGRELYDANPVFRRVIDTIDDLWRTHSSFSLRDACFNAKQSHLDECELAQPVTFMLQCAILELLKTWGVYPDCVIGHSSGEVAAAYATGALSLEDATHLVYVRSTLQQRTAQSGRLLAISLDLAGVEGLLNEMDIAFRPKDHGSVTVEIACENSPANTVICGLESNLRPLMDELDSRNIQHGLLPGNIAFHSSAMDKIKKDVLDQLSFLDNRSFTFDAPMISSVTGELATTLNSGYWWSNIRKKVRFSAAMASAVGMYDPRCVLEIAPHSSLQPVISQCLGATRHQVESIPSFERASDSRTDFGQMLGRLYMSGINLDFDAQYPKPKPIAAHLPPYPLAGIRNVHRFKDEEFTLKRGPSVDGPLVGRRIQYDHPLFENLLSSGNLPWLLDHKAQGIAIMPAAGYIEMILEAIDGRPAFFEMVEFLQPCPIPDTPVRLQTQLLPIDEVDDEFDFTISTKSFEPDANSIIHCRGKVKLIDPQPIEETKMNLVEVDLSQFDSCPYPTGEEFYVRTSAVLGDAFEYGPDFQSVKRIAENGNSGELIIDIDVDKDFWTLGREEGFVFSPNQLDGGLQSLLHNLMICIDVFSMPMRMERVTFLCPPTSPDMRCVVDLPWNVKIQIDEFGHRTVPMGENSSGRLSFYDGATGKLTLYIDNYSCSHTHTRLSELESNKHQVVWQKKFLTTITQPEQLDDGSISYESLYAALLGEDSIRNCRIVEFAGQKSPEKTIFNKFRKCMDKVQSASEYWLIGDNESCTNELFNALQSRKIVVRFQHLEQENMNSIDLSQGLLRQHAADLIIVDLEKGRIEDDSWQFWEKIATPGGLVLLINPPRGVPSAEGWTLVSKYRDAVLLRVPELLYQKGYLDKKPGVQWIFGESDSLARSWSDILIGSEYIQMDVWNHEERFKDVDWLTAPDLKEVDIFCGKNTPPHDLTGAKFVSWLIDFVNALVRHRAGKVSETCRLTVITRKAAMQVEDLRGCAVWGAIRSMAAEVIPEAMIDFCLVDISDPEDLNCLAWLKSVSLREREVAIRNEQPWVPRFVGIKQVEALVPVNEDPTYRLLLKQPGQLSGLWIQTVTHNEPGPDDLEIEVKAIGLNFRDIMVTLDMLPPMGYERSAIGRDIGMEASGKVIGKGDNVTEFNIGDPVVLMHGGCIGNRIIVNRNHVFPKPDALTMHEAAASLSVYITAYYALIHLARLRKGMRVLIHSAMGGVGQAAMQLAQHVGAEIYTTAGTDEKRSRLMAMGAKGAFDSHSHDWYDSLMADTNGEGVDVVLNSLAGRHIRLCLQSLRPGGWHCEIGKVDVYADSNLGMRVIRKNLRFVTIDMDRLMLDDPLLSRTLCLSCLDLLGQGHVKPLQINTYSFAEYEKAMRKMISGQHQGKLLLVPPDKNKQNDLAVTDRRPFLDPESTYLVTGGMGGFGLSVLTYLTRVGARHITLMDRDPNRLRDFEWIYRNSNLKHMEEEVDIDILQGDVQSMDDVERCMGECKLPIKGIFHLAGTLDDRSMTEMTAESVDKVFAPKALGALNLHKASLQLPLDYFVMLSSTSSTLGNPGQVNYSAASAFLDGLASFRQNSGLPALAYNMAAVAEAGMASRNPHVLRIMRAAGTPPISCVFALNNLDYALRCMPDSDHLVTALFDNVPWTFNSPDYMRLGYLISNQRFFDDSTGKQLSVASVVERIMEKVAELCGHDEGTPDEPLSAYGMNSISVAELGAFLQGEYNVQVSALELMTTATCQSLAMTIVHGEESGSEQADDIEFTLPMEIDDKDRVRRNRKPSLFASPLEDHFGNDDECMSRDVL